MTQTISVPMQDIPKPLSLSDAVGKWTQINNQQAAGQLAQQQETRLADQNQRENKMGELKFNVTQQAGLKDAMTSYKSALQTQAAKLGIQPNTPQYQQLANATYHNGGYDKLVQNMGGHAHDPKTDIDLSAVEAVAGMTLAEQNAADIQQKVAESNALLPNEIAVAEAMSGINAKQDERNFQQQLAVQNMGFEHQDRSTAANQDFQRQLAKDKNDWDINAKMELADAKQAQADAKPLPATIVKEQQKLRDQIGTASQMNNMLSDFEKQIDEGKLDLSLTGNLAAKAKNYLGASNENSRALAGFQAGMEKMRNDSLRLNSGVQTEGDAVRAWNELFANINDKNVVRQRLAEIKKYNESAIEYKKNDINAMRAEYGKGEFDDSGYVKQQTQSTDTQAIPEGYKMQRNKRTGETRLVPIK